MKKLFIPILFLASACSTTGAAKEMNNKNITTHVFVSPHCAMYDGKTPRSTSQGLGFLTVAGSALLTSAIDQGLSLFSQTLTKLGEDKEHKKTASVVTHHFTRSDPDSNLSKTSYLKPSTGNQCILIVSGQFAPMSASDPIENAFARNKLIGFSNTDTTKLIDKDKLSAATGAQLKTHINEFLTTKLISEPAFIYEGVVSHSEHREAFLFSSTYLWVNRLQSTRSSSAKRGLGLSIAWDGPHATQEKPSTLSAITLDFGSISAGHVKTYGQFKKGERSVLMKAIQPDDVTKNMLALVTNTEIELATAKAAKAKSDKDITDQQTKLGKETDAAKKKKLQDSIAAEQQNNSKLDSQEKEIDKRLTRVKATIDELMPIEIKATIIETRKGSDVAKFFASVFDGASKEIGEAIKDGIVPSRLKTAAEEKLTEQQAAQTKLEQLEDQLSTTKIALLKAKKSVSDLADNASEFDREIAMETLQSALTAHNRIRVKLELPILTEY